MIICVGRGGRRKREKRDREKKRKRSPPKRWAILSELILGLFGPRLRMFGSHPVTALRDHSELLGLEPRLVVH